MLTPRYLVTISVSAVMTLAWGVSATAQTTSPPRSKFEKLTQVQHRNNNISQTQEQQSPPAPETVPQLEENQPSAPTTPQQNQQSPPASETVPQLERVEPPQPDSSKNEPAPENLNPNANPLLFPTKPEEVEIDITEPISLNQAVELALRNNKDLQSARITLERRQAELDEARSLLYPNLSTQVQFDRDSSIQGDRQNQEIDRENERIRQQRAADPAGFDSTNQFRQQLGLAPIGETSLATEESTNFSGNLELSYNIYTGGRRGAQIERAERFRRQSELDVERLAEQTRFEATDRYYRLQNADAQVAIAQAAVEDASQSLRDAQLLEQAGLGTRFDTLRSEVDLARANQDLTSAISQQRIARRQLAETLSVAQEVELTAADEIQEAGRWPLSLEESIVLAYKNRAELEQRLIQREIGQQDRVIALADIKPQVDFFAQYNFANNFDDSLNIADGYTFGARMRWTLFDGGSAFARARQADRNVEQADTDFARDRNEVRLQVEEGYYNLTANQENIETTRLNVQRAEESLRLARLRFQAGVGTQTDVINSQRDLTEARSQFLQAIIGYNQSLNSLQRAVSNLPDNRLFESP
ncbi:MAG: TolC family protein [Hydrococcus sp. Prado102]|jgi:OMF family outer membrane factor|nr:TolC family protein [Hydrococcus sp. Prado102]